MRNSIYILKKSDFLSVLNDIIKICHIFEEDIKTCFGTRDASAKNYIELACGLNEELYNLKLVSQYLSTVEDLRIILKDDFSEQYLRTVDDLYILLKPLDIDSLSVFNGKNTSRLSKAVMKDLTKRLNIKLIQVNF